MKPIFKTLTAFAVLFATTFFAPGAFAQATGASREGPTQITGPDGRDTRRFPSIFGSPSAFPSPGGTGFAGLNYVNPREGIEGNGADGDDGAGYTIGNPVENVSVTFGVAITSLQDFADSGSFSVSAARAVSITQQSLTFVGASAGNLGAWGDAQESPESYAAYISHLRALPTGAGEIPVQFTIGYGDETTFDEDGETIGEGAFVGLGVGVAQNFSLGVSATETQLNAGVGFGIPELPSVSVSMGVFDITNNVERRQFSLGVSLGF
ncbi:MAG: hypothetical protein AAGC82_17480 [Pseudomonadota bacterium]